MKIHPIPDTAAVRRRSAPFRSLTVFVLLAPWLAVITPEETHAQDKAKTPDANLQQWLKQYPEADANGDGILTESEARAFKQASRKGKNSQQKEAPGRSLAPTHADVGYGAHERNKLDFWRARSDRATPVLVFFHGGSFKAGDKAMVQGRPIFQECLNAGISVASVNYRFSSDAPYPAPMHDGARAVQFLRSKAKEWNIRPDRVAVSGSSAGATLALWIALHDDLADPASADPVARHSTRVTCASPHSGTAGLEAEYFQRHAGVTKLGAALWQLFGAGSQVEFESADKRALQRDASPLHHATQEDPPLFLTYAGHPSEAPFASDSAQKDWIHHVCLGLPLKAAYNALGQECELHHQGNPPAPGAEIAFLKRHLLKETTANKR